MGSYDEAEFARWGHEPGRAQVATDRDVSSRRIGVDWKQGKVMRAETARAPECRQLPPIHGVRWGWFMECLVLKPSAPRRPLA